MKKFFLLFVLLMSASLSSEANTFLDNNSLSLYIQQTSDWEYLGKIEARCAFYSKNFNLYVKVIGGKLFYQVRDDKNAYSVSLGNFSINNKKYNAKFTTSSDTFYFNLPN